MFRRRKEQAQPVPKFERPAPRDVPRDVPHDDIAEEPLVAASPPPSEANLQITFESLRMSASLINATLAYRLTLAAPHDAGPLEIRLQMTSAHASRSTEEQFGDDDIPANHRIASLAGGERVVIEGEIRLPLNAITPIRQGNAALFVPLVRIAASSTDPENRLDVRRVFVVGQSEGDSGGKLQPFRLDLGPRVFARVSQHELVVPALS